MRSKTEPGISVSFMDRFKLQGEWWQKGNELLNLQNINACPPYYKGTVKAWVEELTTFIYLQPKDWERIYEEYLHMATGNGNRELKFYRNEEDYLRLYGIGEIYLKITGAGEPLDYKILSYIGQGLSEHAEELFYSYLEYAEMGVEEKKCWIESIEKNIRKDMADKDLSITLVETLDESAFSGNELYFDLLNDLYMIL